MRKILTLGCALALCTSALFADEPKKAADDMQKAQMEAWMKASTPGDAHKKLDGMIGTWDVTVKSWMAPGTPPMESTGTAVNTWVLGGRWVHEEFTGSFMNMPFNGIGYTGYDNIKKQYVGTWMDNMSTAVMMSTGKGGSGSTMEFASSMDDPMTGKAMPVTEKLVVTDADHHMMEMWSPGPDGKMFKMMEIWYTRKK
ncbi:MAG TPA: DUF1579 domain-containing protein [Thermoanaerobaculia bacterium]|nr:DUF1579 domain-containing protein [Thermoanaerobaculia bacterium]